MGRNRVQQHRRGAKLFRVIGVVAAGFVVLLAVAAVSVFAISEARLNRTYAIANEPIQIPSDTASIERGRHLAFAISKCVMCHGENLAGDVVFDQAGLGRLVAPNLTGGRGGLGAHLSDADFVRAIRHGVGPDGKGLLGMTSEDYYPLSDADLGALIAYVKSVPPVDAQQPPPQIELLGRALLLAGVLPTPSAERIDHSAPRPPAPLPGVTLEYGLYLANVGACTGCHGPHLSGGQVAGAPPGAPPAANLTPAGEINGWTDADIARVLREGTRPGGSIISPFMPWKYTAQMTDDEIKAIILYLRSLPARPTGNH
jgi:mono/diheme cytochrome c family protein